MSKSGPRPHPHPRLSAAEVLAPVWRRQADELRACEAELRSGRGVSVRAYRVAARRLRSSLTACDALVEGRLPAELRADLRRVARTVGAARDTEMLADRVTGLLDDEPDSVEVARVRAGLRELLGSTGRAQGSLALAYLDTLDYDALVRRLDRFCDLPPWAPAAGGPAVEVLRDLLRAEWKRFRRVGAAALAAPRDPSGDRLLHDAHEAAERVRYFAESLVSLFGRRARRMADAAALVQSVLGEHHDCAVMRELLEGPALEALPQADDRFVLGRLHAREEATSERLRDDYSRLFLAADRKALRRWL